jgi:hypothetical protein
VEDRPDASRAEGGGSALEQFLEFVPDAIVGVGKTGRIVLVNQRAETLFGYEREMLVGQTPEMLVPKRFRKLHAGHRVAYFQQPHTREMGTGVELFAVRRDGTEFPVEVGLSHLEIEGETVATVAVRDISERAEDERERVLQDQLNRARRLESIGQLAGGIAQDFNNTLGVILNYAEFVADELEPDAQAREDVEEIRRAAERAAALTRQLLIFSRREATTPEVLDLSEVMGGLEDLLRRALGERIEMKVNLKEGLSSIEADLGQIEQVIINLSLNARDAMPEGGRLSIEAENVELDEEYAYMHPDTEPGGYVRIKVSDTGAGMAEETLERIFDPFFSTKGEGDGLGLAMAYGIVAGAGGRIDVYSEPGFGTTVKIHLPAATAAPPGLAAPVEAHGSGGKIALVVGNEPDARRTAERILTKGGYLVIVAANSSDAIDICERGEQKADLLLTDVIMPRMLGPELAERARSSLPGLRVIYTSGHSHGVLEPYLPLESGHCTFIEKPFSSRTLLEAARELLARPTGTAG